MSYFSRTRLQPNMVPRHWHPGMIALAATMALSACNDKDSPIKADSAPPASAPVATPDAAEPQPAAYVPPDADALYRMVAPIALYPDKLVAQILAGATYPDQISAAETWLGQNPGLQKTALSNAVNAQNWDPSVKSLTQFPNVLEQMASNLPWTTALGKAYYNDPSDVMNAIQVMRSRAYKAGTLKTSSRLKVNLASAPAAVAYTPGAVVTPLTDPVIEPPEQFIEISPSQVDTVYVPQYNPAAVYGQPLPVYGGYRYVEVPPPMAGVPVMAGLLGFGAGIVLAESMDRHPSWGWNAWNMHWGDPERPWRHGERPPPPQARPAVVYNNTTYISQSRTVVQNIHRTDNTYINNIHESAAGERQRPSEQPQAAGVFAAPGTMAAGAAIGAAAMAAGGHALNQRQPAPSPLATQPQGRPDFALGSNRAPGLPRAPNGHALLQPQDPRDRLGSPGAHPLQASQMQAAMAEKALQPRAQEPVQRQQAMQQQQMQQRHTQEQAQQQQAREQQEHRQQAQLQQMQQQRAQEQAQRQQQMQQQAREQQEHRQQAQLQQMQQQRAQEQAQRQQQMQQQAREQQEHRQQAQMQQMQQQRAQAQAQRQQQMQQERQQQAQMQQQRAQEQAQRQQQAQMQAQQHQAEQQARARAEGRTRGDREHR